MTLPRALLIPDDLLNGIVGKDPITGQHLLDLYLATEASQVVCAIALARKLTCTGAILLTDRRTNTVVHAVLVDEPSVYPANNQAVPGDHPLTRIQPGQQVCRESFWATPWGTRSPYYLNATATAKRTYGILAELDFRGISTLHLNSPEPATATRPCTTINCPCASTEPPLDYPARHAASRSALDANTAIANAVQPSPTDARSVLFPYCAAISWKASAATVDSG